VTFGFVELKSPEPLISWPLVRNDCPSDCALLVSERIGELRGQKEALEDALSEIGAHVEDRDARGGHASAAGGDEMCVPVTVRIDFLDVDDPTGGNHAVGQICRAGRTL
jgi:hypothetical protein